MNVIQQWPFSIEEDIKGTKKGHEKFWTQIAVISMILGILTGMSFKNSSPAVESLQ